MKASKKTLIPYLAFVIFCIVNNAKATSLTGNFVFTTQTQLISFQTSNPTVDSIIGSVRVGDSATVNLNISNLNGLSSIKYISSNFSLLNCDGLTSLSGLNNLIRVGGNMILHENSFIANLNALSNLDIVFGAFHISHNNNLQSIAGLNGLQLVGINGLFITNNAALTSLVGLNSLSNLAYLSIASNYSLSSLNGLSSIANIGRISVDGNANLSSLTGLHPFVNIAFLEISSNPTLQELSGLNVLTSLEGIFIFNNTNLLNLNGLNNLSTVGIDGIFISNNNALTSLNGLNNLNTISGGGLYISENNALNNMSALMNLNSLGGSNIAIELNASLTSLIGIDNIAASSISEVSITGNSMLSTCHIQSICNKILLASSQVFISGNASGCATKAQVQSSCNNLPYVLNLSLLYQGYFSGFSSMTPVLLNQGVSANPGITDSIGIELRSANNPSTIINTGKKVLSTNGTVQYTFNPQPGNYFIVIKHRNGLQTWSNSAQTFSVLPVTYDFTSAANLVFGNNQKEVSPGKFAFYTGDVNQDENIDLVDYSIIENSVNTFASGYQVTDVNGDGNVDLLDSQIVENNINLFLFAMHP